jgi:hypothetical protein
VLEWVFVPANHDPEGSAMKAMRLLTAVVTVAVVVALAACGKKESAAPQQAMPTQTATAPAPSMPAAASTAPASSGTAMMPAEPTSSAPASASTSAGEDQ